MSKYSMADYAAKAREAVAEGIVLLRNENGVLPLAAGTRVAVFGPKTSIVRGERVEESLADEFVEPLGTWPSDHKGVWVELRMDE